MYDSSKEIPLYKPRVEEQLTILRRKNKSHRGLVERPTERQTMNVRVEGEVEALKKAKLIVFTNTAQLDDNLDNIDVKIFPKDNVSMETKTMRNDGKIEVEFMAEVAGQLTAEVQVNGKHVSNSPLLMNIQPQKMGITREFQMKGIKPGSLSLKGIAINKDTSRTAVADDCSHTVHVFNLSGDILFKSIKFYRPQGLTFLNQTDLVIADNNNHRMCIINTKTGKMLKTFGSLGNGDGELRHPHGVHVDDDGNIIVCDYGNHRVQVFTRDGDYQYQFGLSEPEMFYPVSVVTHGGRFYVSDSVNCVIHVFEKRGNVLYRISTIGEKGNDDAHFTRVWGLAIGNDNHLLVCDRGNNRIQKFTLDGCFVGKTCYSNEMKEPVYVTVLEDGQYLVTCYHSGVFFVEVS